MLSFAHNHLLTTSIATNARVIKAPLLPVAGPETWGSSLQSSSSSSSFLVLTFFPLHGRFRIEHERECENEYD
jgi:hypothetical protein